MPVYKSPMDSESVAYYNGRVYTINEAEPWAEGFIVSESGIFVVVGSSKAILAVAEQHGLICYNLNGQFVMPGLHDAHIHMLYAGSAMLNEPQLPETLKAAELAGAIETGMCSCAYAHVYGDWIAGATFAIEDFDREILDKDYPDTPIAILGGATHSLYVNTAALRASGYDIDNEPDFQGAVHVRRPDGSLTGELRERAMQKAALALPKIAVSHAKRCIKRSIAVAHSCGLTSVQEAAANSVYLEALKQLEAESALKLDISTHIVYSPGFMAHEDEDSLKKLISAAESYRSKHVDTRFIKFLLDGVPLPPLFTSCGLDVNGAVDESKIMVPDLEEALPRYDALGFTCKIHATGQGSTRRALDVIEKARRLNPGGPRHEIAHCNGVHPDDFARFKNLNVTAEMSPAVFFKHPVTAASNGAMDWNFARMLEIGTHITMGMDWSGGYPLSLLPHCAAIVEDVGSGSKQRGGEILCKILTLNGAQAVGREGEAGSIEVGKKANFITVSKDLSCGDFDGAQVLKTWFEGEIVWDHEAGKIA